ncbi:MAG TPA: chromate transporter [Pseudonocardiaceae bacterium]|jgi:chromate transporter|nr:chromate transporter [Pseudonocardiaceae bacterium]
MSIEQTFVAVFLASLLGFGGLGSLPVLRGQLSAAGLTPDQLLLSSLAVGNISPGPNGLYLIAVGYFVDGYWGAAAATVAVLLPPLLVLLLDKLRAGLIHLRRFRSALRSLSLAVVALLATSSGSLAWTAAHTVLGVSMLVAGTVLLLFRVAPLAGVVLAVGVGLLVGL